jgi:hypothetical protein
MPRIFRALLLLSLAGQLAALSACGGGSSSNVKDTLDKAFSTPVGSANVSLDVRLSLKGLKQLNGPVKLSLQGPYESGGGKTIPKVDWDIAASASGQNFNVGFISTGDNAYVTFQGQSYEVGTAAVAQINKQIVAAAGQKSKNGLGQFGIHPRDWLTDAKDEGSDKVAGTDTNHVSAALDVGKLLDDVNTLVQKAGTKLGGASAAPSLTPQEKQKIQQIIKNPRFDVYVGKSDHVIRRLSADLSFEIPQAQQAQVGGLQSGTLSFSIEFSNVGRPQTITTPKNPRPISELTAKLGSLGSLLGGVPGVGTSGSSGSSGSGTSTPGADALQKYSQCLQKANPSDPAALQKCAALLK